MRSIQPFSENASYCSYSQIRIWFADPIRIHGPNQIGVQSGSDPQLYEKHGYSLVFRENGFEFFEIFEDKVLLKPGSPENFCSLLKSTQKQRKNYFFL
jgi:hypothetical protein